MLAGWQGRRMTPERQCNFTHPHNSSPSQPSPRARFAIKHPVRRSWQTGLLGLAPKRRGLLDPCVGQTEAQNSQGVGLRPVDSGHLHAHQKHPYDGMRPERLGDMAGP